MSQRSPEPLLEGLCFGEGPRWHDGRLWFSDMHDQRVIAVGLDTLPARIPTGLTPQGSQIIVLHVTPQEAELIQFAKEYSSVSTMLLPADVPYTPFDSEGIIVDDLFSLVDRIKAQVEDTLGGTGN